MSSPSSSSSSPSSPSRPRSPIELAAFNLLQRIPTPTNSIPLSLSTTPNATASDSKSSTPPSPPTLIPDIVYSGLISSLSYDSVSHSLNITLRPTVDFRDIKATILSSLSTELSKLEPKIVVNIIMARPIPPPTNSSPSSSSHSVGLSRVKHIIAVSSCKGGVGKSTVALNIAVSLSEFCGKRVGILDADIHGPSLPTLINLGKDIADPSNEDGTLVNPLKWRNLSLMSYGYLARGNVKSAAIMRGAMVSNVIRDLLMKTNWPILDFLIVDMPPGTGDVAITLMQSLNLSGSIVVTAPQRLAYVDVIKGIEMFMKTRVPILSLVENFSYFQCENCTEKHKIFGETNKEEILKEYQNIFTSAEGIPISREINVSCDRGIPFVVDTHEKESAASKETKETYKRIAENIIKQTQPEAIAKHPFHQRYSLRYDPRNPKILSIVNDLDHSTLSVSPHSLRFHCRCAACVDERTGEKKLKSEMIPPDIHPTQMEKKGNYAVAFQWSDGHKSTIMAWEDIIKVAKGEEEEREKKGKDKMVKEGETKSQSKGVN